MVQVLVNIVDFQMNVQEAIEAPRFRSANFPSSVYPHGYNPGRLNIDARVDLVMDELREMGYDVNVYPKMTWECGGACAIVVYEKGLLMGGADPRRGCYALGY
jgi:gamma-glutamyltranspeptidase/glutathione hydrolase